MRTALVTGATGFVGSRLAATLTGLGWRTRALVRDPDAVPPALRGVEIVKGNLDDPVGSGATDGVDVCFHLAALSSVRRAQEDPRLAEHVNVIGTKRLLAAGEASGVRRFIHVSTIHVFGPTTDLPLTEAHPFNPASPYAASKLAGERAALAHGADGRHGMEVVVLRPVNVYGPGQSREAIVADFVARAVAGEPMAVRDASVRRDFIFVDDLVRAMVSAADAPAAAGLAINLGSGRDVSVGYLARTIWSAAGHPMPSHFVAPGHPAGLPDRVVVDPSLAATTLGWRAAVSLDDGIRACVAAERRARSPSPEPASAAPGPAPGAAPMVSIIIPVFNGSNYLAEAIDSALAQTYAPLEVIVVNDGSSDGGASRAVASRYRERIRYLEKPNGGVASALNLGLATMRGTLFSWLSHDDVYEPGKVEAQVRRFHAAGRDCIVFSDIAYIDAGGRRTGESRLADLHLDRSPHEALLFGKLNGCALLIPRDALRAAGGFSTGLPTTQDYGLWVRLMECLPLVHVPEPLVQSRQHAEQGAMAAGHGVEMNRMMIHILDQVPRDEMIRTSGSEIAYLKKIAEHYRAEAHSGVASYLAFRIRPSPIAIPAGPAIASDPAPVLVPSSSGETSGAHAIMFPSVGIEAAVAQFATTEHDHRPAVLLCMRATGGGTLTHVREIAASVQAEARCLFLFGCPDALVLSATPAYPPQEGIAFDRSRDLPGLLEVLGRLGIRHLDIHDAAEMERELEHLVSALGASHDMTLVDYHPIAVRPYLQDNDGRFVGDAAAAALLRPEPIPLFRTALRRIALSRDTARRFETLAPGYPVICADHWSRRALETRDVLVPRIWGGEALRVLVFGPLDRHKGRALVLDAARLAAERGSPLSFHVLGASKSVAPLPRLPALKEHGPFTARSLPGQLGAIAPHVVWFPAQVPETWCYALSDAMEALLPVVAPIIGAFPERCLGRPATWLLPFDSDADRAVRLFTDLHATGLALPPAWSAVAGPAPQTFYPDAYLAAAARGPTGRRPDEA